MSCIIAATIRNKVFIGADTRITDTDGDLLTNIKESKLVKFKSGFVIGAAGTGSVTETLWLMAGKEQRMSTRADVLDFAKKYNEVFNDIDDTENKCFTLLIATKTRIWNVLNKSSIQEMDSYWAIGSGAKCALGAMWLLYPSVKTIADLQTAMHKSLEAACKFDQNCGPPLEIVAIT